MSRTRFVALSKSLAFGTELNLQNNIQPCPLLPLAKFKKLDCQCRSITYSSILHFFFIISFFVFLLISFESQPLSLVHPPNLSPAFRSTSTHLLIQCMSRHHQQVFVFSPDVLVFFRFLVKFLAYMLKRFIFPRQTGSKGVKTDQHLKYTYFY